MGIKASATCVMNFEAAAGWLVGKPHKGMSAMFTMMNAARLAVGIQGLGLAETAYQGARDYAKERLQGLIEVTEKGLGELKEDEHQEDDDDPDGAPDCGLRCAAGQRRRCARR